MSHIISEIKSFYSVELSNDISSHLENVKVREITIDIPNKESLLLIAELILSLAATHKPTIIDSFDSFEDYKDKDILMSIINEWVIKKSDSHSEHSKDIQTGDPYYSNQEEISAYLTRIHTLEKENHELQDEIEDLRKKKYELIQETQRLEDRNKDNDVKYQEAQFLIDSMKNRLNNLSDSSNESVTFQIQISELKGKNADNENLIRKLRDEKEILIGEQKEKLRKINQELDRIKDKAIQYDNLMSRMEREKITFTEIYSLRNKISKLEITIKDQNDKIKVLKSMDDTDKGKLFKKIEELNSQLNQEQNKLEDVKREKKEIIDRCIDAEREVEILKRQNSEIKLTNDHNSFGMEITLEENLYGTNLTNLEDENLLKSTILDLETKLKMCVRDKDDLIIEVKELRDKLAISEDLVHKKDFELQGLNSRINTYKMGYEENIDNLKKITILTEKNYEMSSTLEKFKLDNLAYTNELSTKHKVPYYI